MSRNRDLALLRLGNNHVFEFSGNGSTNCTALVISDAPTNSDLIKGKPFSDRGGMLLRAIVHDVLVKGGIDGRGIGWTYAVHTLPGKTGKTKQPTTDEKASSRSYLERVIRSLEPDTILVTGAVALSCWRQDLSVSTHRGYAGLWYDIPTLITVHPASVIRGNYNDRHYLTRDLESLYCICTGMGWRAFGFDRCSRCKADADHHDPDGVGYCFKHWKQFRTQWKKDRQRWTKLKAIAAQPTLPGVT